MLQKLNIIYDTECNPIINYKITFVLLAMLRGSIVRVNMISILLINILIYAPDNQMIYLSKHMILHEPLNTKKWFDTLTWLLTL